MSKLRQKILEWIRIAGNHSGCHQRSDRSFFYKGKQFPVCARCTGVLVGQITAFLYSINHTLRFCIAGVLLITMGADWGLQELGIRESTNRRRFVTGIAGGFGLFSIYCTAAKRLFHICKQLLNSD